MGTVVYELENGSTPTLNDRALLFGHLVMQGDSLTVTFESFAPGPNDAVTELECDVGAVSERVDLQPLLAFPPSFVTMVFEDAEKPVLHCSGGLDDGAVDFVAGVDGGWPSGGTVCFGGISDSRVTTCGRKVIFSADSIRVFMSVDMPV